MTRWTGSALLLSSLLSSRAEGQGFLDRIHIRHNLETKKEIAQPAFFQITLPRDSAAVFAIGAGVKVDLVATPAVDLGPFVEYLRNTQTDKEQNTLRAGVSAEWQWRELGDEYGASTPILLSQVNYKRDGVKETNGFQASLLYTHAFFKEDVLLPNSTLVAGDYFDLTYAPYIGLEYERAGAGAGTDASNVLRGVFRVEVALYPAAQLIRRRLQLGVNYTSRRDLAESIDDAKDGHSLVSAEVNLFFLRDQDKGRQAGFGLTYVNGEDPLKGLADQEYALLGFKVQI